MLYLLPFDLNWCSPWFKLCHHKVMLCALQSLMIKIFNLTCVTSVFPMLLLCLFTLISNASKKMLVWQQWSNPTLGAGTPKGRVFCSYHTFPAPNKAWISVLPGKANISLIMKNVIAAEKSNLDHTVCHKVKQMTLTANTGFREVICSVCNALCTFCYFNYFVTLGF